MKNVARKIRAVLLNYDMEIEQAKAQLRKAYAKTECFKDSKIHWQQEKYYSGEIEKTKYKTYIEKLRIAKKKVIGDISRILDIPENSIGITATTGEGLTEFGKGNGISVFACITVE